MSQSLYLRLPIVVCLLLSSVIVSITDAREAKEYDKDVIYDESKIPAYDLPPLLLTEEGEQVTTVEQWENVRRPQLIALFSNLVYGRVPSPASPIKTKYEVINIDREFMEGAATRKDLRIHFENEQGAASMLVLVFTPNGLEQAAPAFMKHCFNNTASKDFDADPERPGRIRCGWPLGEFFKRGYGFVAVYQQDLIRHNDVSFDRGIQPLFFKPGQSFPKAREWGNLSTVAWGGSRALDYLETDDSIDAKRVAIMGHSKMGKAALWTAARDTRFAMAVSAQSGCAGAALWRRKSGETLQKMVTRFPYWLCRNAWKFVNQEDDLPVDQHMLLALMAPRPVYVASGIEDTWADPRGEYASAFHAGPVFRLYGLPTLQKETLPDLGKPIMKSKVGYHVREGGHSVEDYDWRCFLDFADQQLKQP